MNKNKDIRSILQLEQLVFEHIEFDRLGLKKNEEELSLDFSTSIYGDDDSDYFKVTLMANGLKDREYKFEIKITGYFYFSQDNENELLDKDVKKEIITKNTIAILMPYLRSQISLLTSQPNVEPVVLPPFNITKML